MPDGALPKHPLYVVSKGRSRFMQTSRALTTMGVPHFVVVENHSRAKVAPDELCHSVRHIARHADAVEEFLTGRDVN